MKIGLVGGTGFVGSHLVRQLLSGGHDLKLLTNQRALSTQIGAKVELIPGNMDDQESLDNFCQATEVVFHLVGIIAETKDKTFQKTIIEGTNRLVSSCQKAGVKTIVYLSAMGTNQDAVTGYHQSKYQSEQAIAKSGINFVVFRPSVIYGEGDGFVSMLAQQIKLLPIIPVIGHGRYLFQPVYIDDLVRIMTDCLELPATFGHFIDIGGPEKLEYVQVLSLIKDRLGKKRFSVPVPMVLMKLVARLLELFLKPAPVTRDQMVMLEMGNHGDNSLMNSLFEIELTKFEDGLRKYNL